MPSEVFDKELFLKISEKAEACRVTRFGDEVKLKLRTPNRLYTLRLKKDEAEAILKRLKCKILELTKEKKKTIKRKEKSTPHEKQEQE